MKDLAPHDRPREKLERSGAAGLGDNELLAIIIGHGTAHAGALAVANGLLLALGGVHGLTRVHRDQLASFPGIGPALAARLIAGVELGRRTLRFPPPDRPQLISPHEMAGFLLPQYGACAVEQFGVVLLDARCRVIRTRLLSLGGTDVSLAHPRELFREAVIAAASSVVVFHNHPSGDATPSADDYTLTRRLVSAGGIMGIDVVDHLILADNTYYSFKAVGKL